MKTRVGKGENHAETGTKNTWGQGQKTRGGNGEKRAGQGRGPDPLLCFFPCASRLAKGKREKETIATQVITASSPPPPGDSTCNHNFVLITFIFVLVLIHEKQIFVQCGL